MGENSALSWPVVIKKFSCSTQLSVKFILLINLKVLTIFLNFFHAQLSWACSAELSMEKVLIVGFFIFMTKWNFMLSWVEHEKSFISSRPGDMQHSQKLHMWQTLLSLHDSKVYDTCMFVWNITNNLPQIKISLTFTILEANLADEKLIILFWFFPENRL